MPVYEYECSSCSSRFELKRSFSEDGPVSCPECGGETQRIFSPVPVIFKGSGFYSTDHRRSSGNLSSRESDTDKAKAKHTDKAKAEHSGKAKTGSTEKDG